MHDSSLTLAILTYNRPEYLKTALSSACNQIVLPEEILIIDDGSSPPSQEYIQDLLDQYPNIIRYVWQENGGHSPARNRAVKENRNAYLMWLDDDDELLPHAVASQKKTIELHPEADIIYADLILCDQYLGEIEPMPSHEVGGPDRLYKFFKHNPIPNPATAIKSETFDKVGAYNSNFKHAEDYDFYSRAVAAGCNFIHNQDRICRYRSHPGNLATTEKSRKAAHERVWVVESFVSQHNIEDIFYDKPWSTDVTKALFETACEMSYLFCRLGAYDLALESLELADHSPQQEEISFFRNCITAIRDEGADGILSLEPDPLFYKSIGKKLINVCLEFLFDELSRDDFRLKVLELRLSRLGLQGCFHQLDWENDYGKSLFTALINTATEYLTLSSPKSALQLIRKYVEQGQIPYIDNLCTFLEALIATESVDDAISSISTVPIDSVLEVLIKTARGKERQKSRYHSINGTNPSEDTKHKSVIDSEPKVSQTHNEVHSYSNTIKAIILGAGREESIPGDQSPLPRCLREDQFGSRVLDWSISAFNSVGVNAITFVGGYSIDEIRSRYPRLSYLNNTSWDTSGVLASLYLARDEIQGPCFISYGDVTFRPSVCKRLMEECSEQICIAVDSTWRPVEYDQKTHKNLVELDGTFVSNIGFLSQSTPAAHQFTGLIYLSEDGSDLLRTFFENVYPAFLNRPFSQAKSAQYAYLTDLLRYFITQGEKITAIDIKNNWVEIDSPEHLSRFALGTKSETLERLKSLLTKGELCNQEYFTVEEWETKQDTILASLQSVFHGKKMAVRSSALSEDSWHSSSAGAFESILDVINDVEAITEAISKVQSSYHDGQGGQHPSNQILVQEMVENVEMSGVVFTKQLETDAPYYIINYDDVSSRTDTITSGSSDNCKSIIVFRNTTETLQDKRLSAVLEVVKEVEEVTGCQSLDIEFAVTQNNQVYVLQARPITVGNLKHDIPSLTLKSLDLYISNSFTPAPNLYGKTTIFADMPDWNPAELIGINPSPLALSLYRYLITDRAWADAREQLGYLNPRPSPLMRCIGGHPYIDSRVSFNSLIPVTLRAELAEKLVNHYLTRLKNHPELHDKIEFEICFTALDFCFEQDSERLTKADFSTKEINEIRTCLYDLTNNIIRGKVCPIPHLLDQLKLLERWHNETIAACNNVHDIPRTIGQLLDFCVQYGTIPFAILARYGFIANVFLRSLVRRGILTEEEKAHFLASVHTVASQMADDMNSVSHGSLTLEHFLDTYGHLRPGTYDITSYRYDERPDYYFSKLQEEQPATLDQQSSDALTTISPEQYCAIQILINEQGFTFDAHELMTFIKEAICLREQAKFQFTKTVSEILSQLVQLGKEFQIPRSTLASIDITDVRSWSIDAHPTPLKTRLEQSIEKGQNWFEYTRSIILPHFIVEDTTIEIIEFQVAKPNFITGKQISGECVVFTPEIDPQQLHNKIVLIEGADPGFDWIFLHKIRGLVTKYGGAASHMSIRAAEFGVPAAIGCGELIYENVAQYSSLELDCKGKTIRAL